MYIKKIDDLINLKQIAQHIWEEWKYENVTYNGCKTFDTFFEQFTKLTCFCCFVDDNIVSFALINDDGNIWLDDICTFVEHRKKGYATLLINHLLSHYDNIHLVCYDVELVEFYKKRNFKLLNASHDCYIMVS